MNDAHIKYMPFFVKIIGIIFTAAGLYFMLQSVSYYIESCNQKDWPIETATVIKVEQRFESNGVRTKTHKLVYDVFYEYVVDEQVYSGTIYGTTDYSKKTGSVFEIKYNPQAHNESTDIMYPSVANLINGIISTSFYIIFSLLMTGLIKIEWIVNIFKRKDKQ